MCAPSIRADVTAENTCTLPLNMDFGCSLPSLWNLTGGLNGFNLAENATKVNQLTFGSEFEWLESVLRAEGKWTWTAMASSRAKYCSLLELGIELGRDWDRKVSYKSIANTIEKI